MDIFHFAKNVYLNNEVNILKLKISLPHSEILYELSDIVGIQGT
jgi:hypothetical protein